MTFILFIDGKASSYTSDNEESLKLELQDLKDHEDNKEWLKGKMFEIKKVK